jgi:hypothetical protein
MNTRKLRRGISSQILTEKILGLSGDDSTIDVLYRFGQDLYLVAIGLIFWDILHNLYFNLCNLYITRLSLFNSDIYVGNTLAKSVEITFWTGQRFNGAR